MLQLRLTEKARKQLGIKPEDIVEPAECDGLGSWTVNVFTEDRRKVLIFVNDKTLYSFILYGVRKDNSKDIWAIFITALDQLLITDGFTKEEISAVMNHYANVEFTKTNSKKVLGNLNDLTQLYKISIYQEGGFNYSDVGEIIHRLNRMPQKNINWAYSIDAVKTIVSRLNNA